MHVCEEQQSALVAHGPPETQQMMPEKPTLSEQTIFSLPPVILSQQSKLLKHGSRSALQAQAPPRQMPVPHSAPKTHRSPALLLSHVPEHDPEQHVSALDGSQVCPPS
jgi:hypothetical protein